MLAHHNTGMHPKLAIALQKKNAAGVRKFLAGFSTAKKEQPYTFYGGNLAFFDDQKNKEKCIAGPAETGKTIAALAYLNRMAWKYPGASLAIMRGVRNDLYSSALETFNRKILPVDPVMFPDKSPVRAYGGKRPERYIYPNGSVIWVGGLDRPGGALSSERDIIYVNQAEEILETARNKLLTRVTGRAGNMPFAQLIYDVNPADPHHWILRLRDSGKIAFYESKHADNPMLYKVVDGAITDRLTEQGEITMETLGNLTGVDRSRLLLGLWSQSTGLVYGDVWNDGAEDGNVTEAADYIPGGGDVYWAADDGYSGTLEDTGYYSAASHPRAFGLYQLRKNGDLVLFYEDLAVKMLSDAHLERVMNYSDAHDWPRPVFVAVDKSAAELKGRMHAAGLYTRNSPSSVDESIKELRRWMGKDKNNHRRFLVHPRCKHTRFEYRLYKYLDNGKPAKMYDHCADRDRYMVWTLRHGV